jgi:transketolase C-terminal domain/subunit
MNGRPVAQEAASGSPGSASDLSATLTYADEFARAYPDRYFEMFIAEQQLVDGRELALG